ncbi:thioredoxin fold domain-containing protein [Rheinheimera sp.]|uniref:thioredoxin fold domain-containing protein n=1 Tax=Rheinheimera sp. TaxID=1869214 RepID=UPI0040472DC4
MNKSLVALALTALVSASFSAFAGPSLSKSEVSLKLQQISSSHPQPLKVQDVEESPLPGFYQVITDKGIIYASVDGKHLLSGTVHLFQPGMQDLTKQRLLIEREKEINVLKGDFITYRAPQQKHEVIVFYDTTCGFCHKLHSEINQYLAQGITIHYAAFPRNGVYDPRTPGVKTEGYKLLQDIWCSEDSNKNLAFNLASKGTSLPRKQCDTSIERQFNLGVKLGIEGTPAIVSMRGDVIVPGYAPAASLKQRLEQAGL